jgi:hypothetical protein
MLVSQLFLKAFHVTNSVIAISYAASHVGFQIRSP